MRRRTRRMICVVVAAADTVMGGGDPGNTVVVARRRCVYWVWASMLSSPTIPVLMKVLRTVPRNRIPGGVEATGSVLPEYRFWLLSHLGVYSWTAAAL